MQTGIKLTLLFIAATSFFFACQKQENGQSQLTFWAMGAEGEQIKQLVPEFEKLHPEIKIKIQSIPWGAAHEKLLTAVAGNTMPDVCQLGNTWIPEFQAIGSIYNLQSFIEKSTEIEEKQFFEGVWKTNVIDDKVYGIPWYVDTRVFFYRKDVLNGIGYSTAPQTWGEWLEISRKIVTRAGSDSKKYACYFSLIANDGYVPVMLIMANGGRFLKDNNQYAAFDDPATREALNFYLAFFKENLASRSMTEFTNLYQGFAQQDFSMMVHGPWVANELRKRHTELDNLWATAPMPMKKSRASLAGGASLVIFKNTKNPDAAWKWIEFLSMKETQVEFFRMTSDLPARLSAWEEPELINDEVASTFYQQLQAVEPTPQIAEWEQIYVKLQEHLEAVIHDKMNLDEMIEKLNREVDHTLEKRRWLIKNNLLDAE